MRMYLSMYPDRYRGLVDVRMGPLSWQEPDLLGSLRFAKSCGEIKELYLICCYETGACSRRPDCRDEPRRVESHAR